LALEEFIGIGGIARCVHPIGLTDVVALCGTVLRKPGIYLRINEFIVHIEGQCGPRGVLIGCCDRHMSPLSERKDVRDLDVELALLLVPDLI